MVNEEPRARIVAQSNKSDITKVSDEFFIVGIGASAGGLKAFESFFSGMPTNSDIGMAFVLIQHLDPNHESLLTELIQHYTSMKVFEVKDGMKVEANCVYIIPPNYDMKLSKGKLHLVESRGARSKLLPIDLFFHSLAKEKNSKAIGIVLSGSGRDGTEGAKAIKQKAGIVIAQSIESSEYSEMPNSVINKKLADYILMPNEMPVQLVAYTNENTLKKSTGTLHTHDEDTLKKIFTLLQKQTNHDFSMYKPNTIGRRIERRLTVNKIDTVKEYYQYLQRSRGEVKTLFSELLIGVTSFFRDKDVFTIFRKKHHTKTLFR